MPEQGSRWLLLSALVSSSLLWLLACYGDTVQSLTATWMSSETFAHGFLIGPISAWLIWRRRHNIRALRVRPNFWMLLPMAVVGFAWLLGHLATVVVVQQYALIFTMILLIWTILGTQIVKAIAFPLLFLLLAVPFGEVLLPTLMEFTADFTVFALRLSGIPVYREGLYFMVPSGNWSVVEACSGLRYLIAAVTLGVLYAYLTYRSPRRRLIFVGFAILVPIVANWMRAYMIVMIGHFTSMKHAVGVDHLIYGWLFFGVVMLMLFWTGSFWREDEIEEKNQLDSSATSLPLGASVWKAILPATLASAGLAAALPAIASHLGGDPQPLPALQMPTVSPMWRVGAGPLTDWKPQFMNPSARISEVYVRGTKRVELFVGYYRNQRQGAQLISSQNALVRSTDKLWAKTGEVHRVLYVGDTTIRLNETILRGRETHLLVWHWYWVDGQYTSNPYWAKLWQAKSMLLGRGDNSAVILVATPYDLSPAEGVELLEDFTKTMLPAVAKVLRAAR